jgi:hypothetical protein
VEFQPLTARNTGRAIPFIAPLERATLGTMVKPAERVPISTENVPVATPTAIASTSEPPLPVLVERAGGAPRFAWDEFFYAEHHNPHTQKAYMAAVKRFLAWAEGEGVELLAITPGMVGQYLVALGGSPAKRNLHLSALRGFFDRLVNRHVVILNPAASVRGVKDEAVEGKTPEMAIEQARTLLAAIRFTETVKNEHGQEVGVDPPVSLVGPSKDLSPAVSGSGLRLGGLHRLSPLSSAARTDDGVRSRTPSMPWRSCGPRRRTGRSARSCRKPRRGRRPCGYMDRQKWM